jgi:hypothetical protein
VQNRRWHHGRIVCRPAIKMILARSCDQFVGAPDCQTVAPNAPTAYSAKTVQKQRDGRANLRPFVAGDPRINRRGRPKGFDEFRRLAQAIAQEPDPQAYVLLDQFIQPNMQTCGRVFYAYLPTHTQQSTLQPNMKRNKFIVIISIICACFAASSSHAATMPAGTTLTVSTASSISSQDPVGRTFAAQINQDGHRWGEGSVESWNKGVWKD